MILKNWYNYLTWALYPKGQATVTMNGVVGTDGATIYVNLTDDSTSTGYYWPANCWKVPLYFMGFNDSIVASGSLTSPDFDDYAIDDTLSDITCSITKKTYTKEENDDFMGALYEINLKNANTTDNITINKIYFNRNIAYTTGTGNTYPSYFDFIYAEILLDEPITLAPSEQYKHAVLLHFA